MFDCIIGIAFISLLFATVSAKAAENSWNLNTEDTDITVAIKNGQFVVTNLADTATKYNWAGSGMSVPLMDKVWIGEKEFKTDWKFINGVFDKKTGTLTLTFENALPKMALRSMWRARSGRGPVEHWMEIENLSGGVLTVSQQDSLSLVGLKYPEKSEVWWINRGGANANGQGGTFNKPVAEGFDLILASNPEDGASPVPWTAIQVGDKQGLYVGWEFSALGRVHVKSTANNDLDIRVGNHPEFKTDIFDKEIFLVPAGLVGCYAGDIDEGSYSLHRFVLEKLRPKLSKNIPDPILAYNLFMDVGGYSAKEADVLRSAKTCKELGFEAFMPDAMWFPETGDWRFDPKRFPNGIKPIEEYIHKNGMMMALWCAWTNGGASSDPGALSVRGPYGHPDWFVDDYPADWKAGEFWGARACLGSSEYKDWATKKTQWLVGNFKLDYLKHDISVLISQCNKTTHRHKYGVDVSYWHTIGYYEVQDELRKAFPDVILENCNGGGHIKDYGVIQRTHYTVTTDTLSNLPNRMSIYDSTFAIPPIILQAYTYDNVYPVRGDTPGTFLWRTAMMGAWQIDPTDTPKWGEKEYQETKDCVELYKEWVRPMLHDVKVHHILPRPDGFNWDGMFYWSPSLNRGTLYIFRPESTESRKTVKLKGLEAKKKYWVWCEDGSITTGVRTGAELMNGIEISLPEQYTSDIVFIQDDKLGKPKNIAELGEFKLKGAKTESDPFTASAEITWEKSMNARGYRIRVSETKDFAKPFAETSSSKESVTIQDLPANCEFFWKAEAYGRGATKENSGGVGKFKTSPLIDAKNVVFASDMEWTKATAGANNPIRRDKNYYDKLIAIGGKEYKKGLWTHAFNDTTPADTGFNIEGKGFASFKAEAGVDDAAKGGSVQFQVLIDGKMVVESPVVQSNKIHRFSVDVKDGKEITLRVLNGGDGYSCDHAVWANAMFIKQ